MLKTVQIQAAARVFRAARDRFAIQTNRSVFGQGLQGMYRFPTARTQVSIAH